MKEKIYDLSHPIRSEAPCTFSVIDSRPVVSYQEGDSHGILFITSRVDNLHSNLCTHIDFPGHLSGFANKFIQSIGEYPLSRFVGRVVILDFNFKLDQIRGFFDESGVFGVPPSNTGEVLKFLKSTSKLEISLDELSEKLESVIGSSTDEIIGVIFAFGLSKYWRYKKYESWEYIYFFNGFLSSDACRHLVDLKLSFIGVDCFQLENPIVNYRGDETILIKCKVCREYVESNLPEIKFTNHSILLGNDIVIYENLNIPVDLMDKVVYFSGQPLNFQIKGLNDNALTRPYALL